MASVSSIGLGSGVLTSELIENLAEAERAPTEARLDNQEAEVSAELSLFGQIKSAVTDLRLPARTLANPQLFESKTVSSGSTAFSANVSSSAATAGSHTLEVTALAKSQTLTSTEFGDSDTTALGTGTLTLSIGSNTTNVTIDNTNNTLDGIAAAINAEEDSGVTASVLYTGTGYKLVLNADETGLANTIDISVSDTGDGNHTDANGLSRLSYTAGALNLTESQAATDAAFKVNGVAITRSSNEVTDAIPGLSLTLNSTNSGSPASLIVSNDTSEVVEKVSEFVEKFNALQTLINDNSVFDPSGATENGLLLGDSTSRNIMNQVRQVLGSPISGMEDASVRSLAEIGISTDYQTGLLTLNEETLSSALESAPEDVTALFSDQGRTSDSQVSFATAGIDTVPGTYSVNITTAATRGELAGTVGLGVSTTIDADNDEFTIKIDGTTSGTITLDVGSYTQAELAAEIQSKINTDSTLAGDDKSVTVSLDGSNQLVINSNVYGSSSQVEITAVDTNTAAQLGLAVATGTDGVDVEGTINGQAATGSGQILSAAEGDEADGIKLIIEGSATGSRGTVTYIEGVGEQLVDLITNMISIDGSLTSKTDTLNDELILISEERADLDERIESLTSRLAQQFTAADILVSKLNSTLDFVKAQLDALAGTSSE